MAYAHYLVISAFIVAAVSQRSTYVKRPVGYPVVETTTDALGNRFGGPTEPLPVEALGDRDLVNRLSKLPVDSQPFWFINWKQLEEKRRNQETYAQRPNPFNEAIGNVQGLGQNQNQNFQWSQARQI